MGIWYGYFISDIYLYICLVFFIFRANTNMIVLMNQKVDLIMHLVQMKKQTVKIKTAIVNWKTSQSHFVKMKATLWPK